MTCRILLVAACVMVLGSSPVAAQQAALRPHPSTLFVPPVVTVDSLQLKPTYWKEGALIGGIPMALLGAIAFHGLCEWNDEAGDSNCALAAVGGALISGAVGGIVGALIGGQFPKSK